MGSQNLKQRHQVLVLVAFLSAITYLDRVCISIAGPRIQQALSLSPVQWGWVGSLFAISYCVFEIPSGYLGDRIGARAVLSRIVLWWSAFTALTGLAWNYGSLLTTRFLFGMGEAGAAPNMFVTLARWFPLRERARGSSVIMMSAEVGTALTPLIVIPLQKVYGWRVPFFVLGVIGVIWVAVWRRRYHDHPSDSPGIMPDELEEIGHHAGTVQHTLRWKSIVRSWNLWIIIFAGVSFRYGVYFFQFWLPTYLVKSHGFTETGLLSTTWLFLAGAIANLLGGSASDAMVTRVGLKAARRVIPVVGLAVSAVCLTLSILVDGKYLVMVLLSLSYGGLMFAQGVCWAVCIDIGASFAGAVSAARNTGAQAGAAVSSAVFGHMVAKTGNYNAALVPVIVMIALSAALCARVDATEQLFPELAPNGSEY